MRYFELPPTLAEKASRYLYQLMYPENATVETKYLFDWITLNGITVIRIDETKKCPIYLKAITDTVLNNIATNFGSRLTTAQKTAYKDYIKNNTVVDLLQLVKFLPERSQAWVDQYTPQIIK